VRVRGAVLREAGLPPPYAESRPLELCELELAPPGPGELLVRIRAAGLCHSDLSAIDGSRPRALPMVVGHEAAGEIVALGDDVDDLEPGDHVVLTFVPTCGSCPFCLQGRVALCEPGAEANASGTLLSGARRFSTPDGEVLNHHLGVSGFAEHVVVSRASAVWIDPGLPFEIAALFGCAVLTGVGAAIHTAGIVEGDRVAVFGLGGVGLAALLGARLAGASQLVAVDIISEKLELALELGATDVVPADEHAVERVRALTGGGAERVLETVGNERVLAQAYAATRRGGTTVTVGLPHPDRQLTIQAVSLVTEERTLRGSYLGSCVPSRDVPRFVAWHAEGRLPVEALLTHRLPVEELNEGFDRLARGEAVRQVVVFPSSSERG